MVWCGMVWYGMVWYGMVVVVVVRALSTCRREKLPDTLSLGRAQGSSGLASRWPGVYRRRPRGRGAGGRHVWGGGCARKEEGGATCVCYPGALPRCGGEGDPTWARRRRDGGAGWRDHLFGDLRGPDSPCCRPPLPHDREGAICLRAPEPHERGRGGALPVSCGAYTAQLVRPWRAGFPVGPAKHSWCGPGVRGFLWGMQSTAGAALACRGSFGACIALLVRPWRAGVPVGLAQHSWCGPGVRGFLWGLHSTAGAALACGGFCGACTAQLVRPWRAGIHVGPAQHSWCGPGVLFASRGAGTAQLVRPWRAGVPMGLYSTAGAGQACCSLPVGPAQHSWCGPGARGQEVRGVGPRPGY